MSSSEQECDIFEPVVQDLQDYTLSLEFTDHEDTFYKVNTEGTSKDQYELINKLTLLENVLHVPNLIYDGIKYMHLKNIKDEDKTCVYIYISTEVDNKGIKKGMFITTFFAHSLIATFDHKKINTTTARIISVLEQYQEDE